VLRQTCIQANVNVVKLEPSQDSTFDYWLTISTLAFRKPLLVPVKLSDYHREVLKGKTINTSVTLNKHGGVWWLTLGYDDVKKSLTSRQKSSRLEWSRTFVLRERASGWDKPHAPPNCS
jgi:hypothetical protein